MLDQDIRIRVTIVFDKLGRQQSVTNGVATSVFAYDSTTLALDTETISYDLNGDNTPDFTRVLDRKPTDLGRDTGWQLKNGNTIENEATYTYHATTGRLDTIRSGDVSSPQTFTYGYAPNSSLLQTVTGPAHTVTNQWEETRDVLASKENKAGTTTISKYDYLVNAIGQRTNVSTSGTAFPATPSWTWGYDSLGQVTSADSSVNTHDRAYQYDAIGNRKKSADSLTLPTDDNYTSNELNQYSAIGNPQSTIVNPIHDDDGNLRFDGGANKDNELREFVWDAESRLITVKRVADGTTLVSYTYDSQSRRVAQSTGTATTLYVYDAWNPIAEYTGTTISKTFTWGMDLSGSMQGAGGVGGMLAVTDSTGSYYPTYDGNGNVSEYIDSNGAILAHYEYDPFGRETVSNGTNPTGFAHRFSTKPVDATTGLLYYGYRYYDPVTGRWPSRDPIDEHGGINLYKFLKNPLATFDRFGLSSAEDNACTKRAASAYQKNADLIKKIKSKKKCSEPLVYCGCCDEDAYAMNVSGDPSVFPNEEPYPRSIKVCTNNVKDMSADRLEITLRHEMIHALQNCKEDGTEGCDDSVCREIEAYYNSECSKYADPVKRKMCTLGRGEDDTIGGVLGSSSDYCGGDSAAMEDSFNRQYDKCISKNL